VIDPLHPRDRPLQGGRVAEVAHRYVQLLAERAKQGLRLLPGTDEDPDFLLLRQMPHQLLANEAGGAGYQIHEPRLPLWYVITI